MKLKYLFLLIILFVNLSSASAEKLPNCLTKYEYGEGTLKSNEIGEIPKEFYPIVDPDINERPKSFLDFLLGKHSKTIIQPEFQKKGYIIIN